MPTLIMQIVQKDPVSIRQVSAGVPIGLQRIIDKLLQKKPEKRFQSGAELKQALQRELDTLCDQKDEQRGYLPMQVKWTAIMSAVVACAMALSSFLVYRAQSDSLHRQAIDAGISLSKFIAVQAAIPVLGEDWITLDSMVQDASARDTFSYLIVSDHEGVVRSASDTSLVGKPWEPSTMRGILLEQGKVVVSDLGDTFNFRLPVLFQDTVVGTVNVGLDTSSLDDALATTSRMMIALAFAIVLAVSLVIYILNKQIAKNLLLATAALKLFRPQHLEARISKLRDDEFGDLFAAFNNMADALEQSVSGDGEATGTGAVSPPTDEPDDLDVSGITQGMVNDQTIVKTSAKKSVKTSVEASDSDNA